MVRGLVIALESALVVYLFFENRVLSQLVCRLGGGHLVREIDFYTSFGFYMGSYLVVVSFGLGLVFLALYLLFQKVSGISSDGEELSLDFDRIMI